MNEIAQKEIGYITENVGSIRAEMAKAVIGYEDIVEDMLVCIISRGHMLIEGVPGIAKTTIAKGFSKIMGLE